MSYELRTNFKILNKQMLGEGVKRLDIKADELSRRIQPGQFVAVMPTERSEPIPLSVVDADPLRGSISLVFQEVGFTTKQLGALQINETIFNISGPLGKPSDISKVGNVVCITTGAGAAHLLPICRAHKKMGNKVIGIIGAKTKKNLMLESQLRLSCHKILIATNDGSYIKRGLATDLLKEVLTKEKIDLIYAVGSVDMMEAVCGIARAKNIPVRVSVHPLMMDCAGICGSCRVLVGGKTLLSCVDGPEFDGHMVDFEVLRIRMNAFVVKPGSEGKELEWYSQQSQLNRPRSEFGILTKFLSGFQKSKS